MYGQRTEWDGPRTPESYTLWFFVAGKTVYVTAMNTDRVVSHGAPTKVINIQNHMKPWSGRKEPMNCMV